MYKVKCFFVEYIYGLKNQYAPNLSSECPKPGVCIFALNL